MIVERFCTCTFEERKLAFEWQIETEIKRQLTMYINFLNSEIDLDLRKHQIESDIKNYELIFKSTYKELENIEITLSYPPNFNRIHKSLGISQMKEFKSKFRNNQFNQYRDYHKAECPILDINRLENGDTSPIKYHMPYSTNYFFFLELKRYYNKTYLVKVNDQKTAKVPILTPKKIVRNQFIQVLNNEYHFSTFLESKYTNSEIRERILTEISENEIPYIFALFKVIGYFEKLDEFFQKGKNRTKMFEMLGENLSLNKRSIQACYSCLNEDSPERKNPKNDKFDSFNYIKDIPLEFIRGNS